MRLFLATLLRCNLALLLFGVVHATSAVASPPAPFAHLFDIGEAGSGPGQFDFPYDVAIFAGRLYVGDSNNNRVQVFDLDGSYLFEFGGTGSADGQFRRNRGIGVSPENHATPHLYVTDAKNDRIQRFDLDGTHLASWGSIGDGDLQFFRPRGIAVAPNGNIVICDADNHRVKIYRANLSLRNIFGARGSQPGQFVSPFDCDVAADGTIYVVDSFNARVQTFDLDGKWLGSFGSFGLADGQFVVPKGLAIAPDGTICVADTGNGQVETERLQLFTATGEHLQTFGRAGGGEGEIRFVTGMDFDSDGRLYVAESENQRVSVWGRQAVATGHESFGGLKGRFQRGSP